MEQKPDCVGHPSSQQCFLSSSQQCFFILLSAVFFYCPLSSVCILNIQNAECSPGICGPGPNQCLGYKYWGTTQWRFPDDQNMCIFFFILPLVILVGLCGSTSISSRGGYFTRILFQGWLFITRISSKYVHFVPHHPASCDRGGVGGSRCRCLLTLSSSSDRE